MITKQQTWNLYDKYVAAWAPISRQQRASLLAEAVSPDIEYFTPNYESGNLDSVIEDMEGFQQKFPGAHFDIEDISAHHDVALFTWILIEAGGAIGPKGHDQIRISTDGKIASIVTFGASTGKP